MGWEGVKRGSLRTTSDESVGGFSRESRQHYDQVRRIRAASRTQGEDKISRNTPAKGTKEKNTHPRWLWWCGKGDRGAARYSRREIQPYFRPEMKKKVRHRVKSKRREGLCIKTISGKRTRRRGMTPPYSS